MAIGVFSRGIAKIAHLPTFLGAPIVCRSWGRFPVSVHAIAGWGMKPTSLCAQRYAQRHGLRYVGLEDGFLRSVGLGNEDQPCSLIVDDVGMYYDASRPSRLETLALRQHSDEERSRAGKLALAWRASKVSKYNHARDPAGELPTRFVLAIDQTCGDASVQLGLAGSHSFHRMIEAALDENPESHVLVKVHPDVFAGRKKGYLSSTILCRQPRVQVLGDDVHPVNLIQHAEAIYVVTSQVGFEGLLWGKRVRTFGMPFYAGWGLTKDDMPSPTRRGNVQLEHLVHAALIEYPCYVHPETAMRSEPEEIIEWLALQRRMRCRFPRFVHAVGFSYTKRPVVRAFFQGSTVRFVRRAADAPEDATLVVWGRGDTKEKRSIIRLEDAFLRSVGLGADLVRPLSLVQDRRGLYYDATAPSDLEHLLQTAQFSPEVIARAQRLHHSLLEAGITKYNVGQGTWQSPRSARRVILVPGQVESDASICYGAHHTAKNIKLLQAVRESQPSAYVVYKPHPDVLAGLRRKGENEDDAPRWCDEVVSDVPMSELLKAVDEVHVMTSLAGFEALLCSKPVTCHGIPFYAGWGLTEDLLPIPRRHRRLTIDELIAGTLILYPAYVSRKSGKFTTPERALDELVEWKKEERQLPRSWTLRRFCLRLWKSF